MNAQSRRRFETRLFIIAILVWLPAWLIETYVDQKFDVRPFLFIIPLGLIAWYGLDWLRRKRDPSLPSGRQQQIIDLEIERDRLDSRIIELRAKEDREHLKQRLGRKI